MGDKSFKRFIPAFIPLLFELMRHFRRDSAHNNDIKKFDKSQEKLGTIEHLLVRLEKKMIQHRDNAQAFNNRIVWWMALNSALLIAIAVKLFLM